MRTDAPDQLHDFFSELEHGADVVLFPGFEDEDGERLVINATDLVYAIAPLQTIDEGDR